MADLQSIIRIIFSGEDQVSETARNIGSQLSGIGDIATGIASPFADLANKILVLDAAVSAVALVIGVKAVQAANEFGAGIADLNRFLSEGEGNASQYKEQFDDLSVKYGTSVNEIVQSTSDWRAANYDIKTSLELTRIALDYSIAGQVSAGEATETLKKIVSGMAIANEDVIASSKRMGDILNYVADSSKTNFKEIAEGVSLIAPSINTSGASFEQMTAIVSVLAETLQSGSQAGTSLSVIIGQLKQPSQATAAALKEFGLEVDKNNITQQSFYEILNKIGEKWPTLTDAEKANYAQRLVSAEQANRFAAIMENWGTVGERASAAVANATLSMSKEVERALNTAGAAFKSFDQSINLLFITLGTQITPGVVDVVKALTELDVTLKKAAEGKDNPFQPLSDALNGALGEFADVIEAVSKNLPEALQNVDFSGLITAFDGLFGELDTLFGKFFGEIDVTTVEGLSAALQKIVDVGSLLVTTTQGIVSAFEPFADAAGQAVERFSELDKASQLDFGEFIGSAKLLVDAGLSLGTTLFAIGKAGADMGGVLDLSFGVAKAAANALQITFDAVALKFYEIKKAYLEGKIADEDTPWGNTDKLNEYRAKLADVELSIAAVTSNLDKNGKEFDDGAAQIQKGVDALNKSEEAFNKNTAAARKFADQSGETKKEIKDTSVELEKLSDIKLDKFEIQFSSKGEAAEAAGQIKKVGDAAQQLVPKLVTVRDENGKVVRSYTEMTNVVPGVTGTLSVLGSSMDKAKDKAKEAAKESDNFRIKMEEIASNERIKNIEAYVSINVADLEAQAKRVESTFASIDNTVSNTGDLLGSLFGGLASADTYARLKIESQIDLENKRRQEALDLQKKLTQAEIDNINAKTRALDRGDSVIKVSGDGLEPYLKSIMFELFKAIRIEVNADAADFLLAGG